jgi:DNA polymerase III epsilon subunit-like protein
MQTIYAMIDTESEGFIGKEREGACAWCVGALLDNNAWRAENADTAIPNAEQCAVHYAKGTFSVYWAGLDRLDKKHKESFTKFAVGYLSRQQAAAGKPIYLKRDASGVRFCSTDVAAVAFDVAKPGHVCEVLRVFFGPEVVACGIVLCAYDARNRTMEVLHEDYAVYRPSAEHKASCVAQAIHGLHANTLARGEDIAALHARLLNIIEQHPSVVFVAHYAPHDRGVLLESIDRSTLNTQNLPHKAHLLRLRRELLDARRWTCTWQRSVLLARGFCGRDLKNYKLPTLYEAATHMPLLEHHNARTDAYACAVIFCMLLGCDDNAVKTRMHAADSPDLSAAICTACI